MNGTELSNINGAADSFAAEDMINPVALAKKLQSGDHPFSQFLLEKFSQKGRDQLAALLNDGADPDQLAEILAEEFSAIAAGGQSVYLAEQMNGVKLRKSTRKLTRKNPQGDELERMNTLLIQDFFTADMDHDSCELAEVVKKKKIEFRIYKERRKLKTKWNESFKITFPAIDGQTSTHAPSLDQAHVEIDTLADRVLSGEAPVTKQQNKERDAKAKAYDEIAGEAAKVGKKNHQDVLEFIKDAVKAQIKLGVERPLLEFVLYAVKHLVAPVKSCFLVPAADAYTKFMGARKDVCKQQIKRVIAVVKQFVAAMPLLTHERVMAAWPEGEAKPETPKDVLVEVPEANEIQTWLNSRKLSWKTRLLMLDIVRAFLVYCRDGLHALPPGQPTAAHVLPRPKPDSDEEPVPAVVLSLKNVWRILVNLQDLETVWFFALAVFAGLHQSEIKRLVWENDIEWKDGQPHRIFVAAGKGKNKHGKRMGAYVKVQEPLKQILALGRGRTGKIVLRKSIRPQVITPLARLLKIKWVGSIMRHTFASNLLNTGYTTDAAATELRNTVPILLKHYYAPLSELEVRWCFRLRLPIERFKNLPFQNRNWDWNHLLEFDLTDDGKASVRAIPADPSALIKKPRVLKKRQARIVWPDKLELQVMLWEKTQDEIGRQLGCRPTSVSSHAKKANLLVPPLGHWNQIHAGIPVETPPEILKAREMLERRKQAGGEKCANDFSKSSEISSAQDDNIHKPATKPEDSQSGANGTTQEN